MWPTASLAASQRALPGCRSRTLPAIRRRLSTTCHSRSSASGPRDRPSIDQAQDVLLTARAECYHVGHPDPFRESVRRLQAYAAAGADVLFAPGPQTPAEIEALVEAVAPKPLNLLVVRDIGLRVEDIAALGVRRISVGGALALAAWTGFMRAAQTLKSEGSFAGLANLVPYAEINGLFAADLPGHQAQKGLRRRSARMRPVRWQKFRLEITR